jgi:two-component system chemotaxis response regulator CheY
MGTVWPFGVDTGAKGSLGRILVVDDEEHIRKVVTMILTKAGYDVVEAEDGEKAIAALNAGDNPLMVDVVLCDIRMPKINGVEAIRYFRDQYPSVPVIVLTGYPDTQDATTLFRQGVMEYLVKPVDRERLLASVASAMEQRNIKFYP